MVRISYNQEDAHDFWFKLGNFMRCMFQGSLFLDREFLEEVDLFEDMERTFDQAGWSWFPNLGCDANEEDTREFLASVAEDDELGLRYRHRGTYYSASEEDFAEVFEWTWPTDDNVDTHSNREAWSVLSGGEHYISGRCNASSIILPKFFILHRIVSQNILGRKPGSTKPSVHDMEILRGCLYNKVVPWCALLWHHWINLSQTTPIFVGSLITYFLQFKHGAECLEHHSLKSAEYLTKERMRRLRAIKIGRNGEITWRHRENVAIARDSEEDEVMSEDSQPLRRCTRARARARAHAPEHAQHGSSISQSNLWTDTPTSYPYAHIPAPTDPDAHNSSAHMGSDAQNLGQQGAVPPLAISPDMNTWMFNLTRVMEYLAPPSADVAVQPPIFWRPGDPVPVGFHIRNEDCGGVGQTAENPPEDFEDDDEDGGADAQNEEEWVNDSDWSHDE